MAKVAASDQHELEMARILDLDPDSVVRGSVRSAKPQHAEWQQVGFAERTEPLHLSGSTDSPIVGHRIEVSAEVFAALTYQEAKRRVEFYRRVADALDHRDRQERP